MSMLTKAEFAAAQSRAASILRKSGIPITDKALEKVEVADFGLSRLDTEGAQILTLIATDRIAVKLIVMFPNQTIPEHWHPRVGDDPGKEETVRVVSGTIRFYIPGAESIREGFVPDGKEDAYSVRHELILKPGEQITLEPGTKHWFQAGHESAVMFSFSTVARDVLDCFTDPKIERITRIQEA
jgi:D-lyxose ketol-isomerase